MRSGPGFIVHKIKIKIKQGAVEGNAQRAEESQIKEMNMLIKKQHFSLSFPSLFYLQVFKQLLPQTISDNKQVIMCHFTASRSLKGRCWEVEGGVRAGCRAVFSSLMDFISGVPVRNHAFIMGVTYLQRYC